MIYFARTLLALFLVVGSFSSQLGGSCALYVGRNLTADGSVLLGGYGDEPSSHWLEVTPAIDHPDGASLEVGVTAASRYPGLRFRIPQVSRTHKYLAVWYSSFAGFPGPLTNGGLNQHLVAGRDVSAGSRLELRQMTPNPQRGLNYSDLARIALERARTAREAAQIVGSLVEEHGYATFGGNSHIFADTTEGWIVLEFAGGQGLWVAERLGADDIRVFRGGYIGEIPLDYRTHPDYMGSENLISFAVEQGWYASQSGKPFNVHAVYGVDRQPNREGSQIRTEAMEYMEEWLRQRSSRLTLQDMMEAVRSPVITRESSGYGQVAHLKRGVRSEVAPLWIALAPSLASPFLPYYLGITDVPTEYKEHRYLTEGEASRFIRRNRQRRESTRSAFRVYKRLFHLVCEHPCKFQDEVMEALTAFEAQLIGNQSGVKRTAHSLLEASHDLAADYLTRVTGQTALEALELAEKLSASIEIRTRLLYGVREPEAAEGGKGGIVHCRCQSRPPAGRTGWPSD